MESDILAPPRNCVCVSAQGLLGGSGIVLHMWCDWKGGLKPLFCVCVCVCVCVCISPTLLDHDGWILPLEIHTFCIRVFSPSKCTYFILDIMAISIYWHLSDSKSKAPWQEIPWVEQTQVGPGQFQAPWGPCHTGPYRERWEGCAAVLDVLALSLTFKCSRYTYTDWW